MMLTIIRREQKVILSLIAHLIIEIDTIFKLFKKRHKGYFCPNKIVKLANVGRLNQSINSIINFQVGLGNQVNLIKPD